ncbi:MAG: DUF1592 domain-containing protein [Planctomycetaceae bacterium]|nr:DUF1592 domain-containing protein [Planctomycetaceae bacterium]
MTRGQTDPSLPSVRELASQYCADCHRGDAAEGGFRLPELTAPAADNWDATAWEKMVKRLRARQMPPAEVDRPTEEQYVAALQELEQTLDRHARRHPQPGRVDAIRRLSRTEYQNAIRDLLAVNIDAEELLPADQSGHGFDNVTLGELPPILLNRYIRAAEKIARLAVGGRERSPGGSTIRLPGDRSQETHVKGLPLGTRGGTVFEYPFTQTGEYEIQLRLMRDRDEKIEGLNGTHEIDVLLDRRRVHRFTVDAPKQKTGWAKDYTLVDAHLKKRFRVSAGPHQVGVTFPQTSASLSEIYREPYNASFNRHRHPRQAPAIYEVSIVGPFSPEGPGVTPSRRQILGDVDPQVADTDDAKRILQRLLRIAYRRDVDDSDLAVPLRFFQQRKTDGFEAGLEGAIAAMLVNPHFLFRVEQPDSDLPNGAAVRLTDFELASRLSFFLWSSLPDDELLTLAAAGTLHEDDVLQQQVQRMLADPRSASLVSSFASQWLYLRNLESFRPDMRLFTDFDDNLRTAMRQETEHLFADMVRHDRSVLTLIDTNTTFLNERLARHYGIPHVTGSHFRPVKVSAGSHRGGILRHASILAVTSYATRTSPTLRGNWILGNILGTPPPPPPANVPALKEKSQQQALTVRERLAEHRANPACASCHNLMDPVGFALENYDAVGRWRVFDDGQSIDSSGALPDGRVIDSVVALEQGIMDRPEIFVGTMTEKLLTFGLGRGIEPTDGPAVRQVVRDAAADNYRFSRLITGIVQSVPFQMKVNQ